MQAFSATSGREFPPKLLFGKPSRGLAKETWCNVLIIFPFTRQFCLSIMNDIDETKSDDCQGQDCTSSNNKSDNWNPSKFILEMRHQALAASLVKQDEIIAVDHLVTVCHALVTTNREIWERCKPFHCTTIASADSQPDMCTFYRIGYVNVRGATPQYHKDCLKFESTPELTKSCFEIPISLPEKLECLVVHPRTEKNDIMPNYELFFQRSMLLVDDILPGFLLEFKAFLENQQIALGKVDAWLMQANEDALLLQSLFKVALPCDTAAWQQMGGRFTSWETCQQGLALSECSRCGTVFKYHNQNQPNGWVSCSRGVQQSGCFPLTRFMTVLNQFECPGTIDVKFCIEIPLERSRMIKFLDYARHVEA